jgi:hypothetical protein
VAQQMAALLFTQFQTVGPLNVEARLIATALDQIDPSLREAFTEAFAAIHQKSFQERQQLYAALRGAKTAGEAWDIFVSSPLYPETLVNLATSGTGPPLLVRYISGSGGRWGSNTTRLQNVRIAKQYEADGWTVTHGAGKSEEWIRPGNGGLLGGTFVDITLEKGGEKMRIQTVTTLANGAIAHFEIEAASRIRSAFPNDRLLLIPKSER